MDIQDLSIDLTFVPGERNTAPASVPSAEPFDLLGGLGDDLGGSDTASTIEGDSAAIAEYMKLAHPSRGLSEGESSSKHKRDFLVRSDDPSRPDDFILYNDNSSLENFNTCNRKAFYYTVLGREPAGISSALTFGGALHAALEQRYKRGLKAVSASTTVKFPENMLSRPDALLTSLEDAYIDRHFSLAGGFRPNSDTDHRTPSRAKNVMRAYAEKYSVEPFEFIRNAAGEPLCEMPFAVPLGVIEVNRKVPDWRPINDGNNEGRRPVYISRTHIVWTGRIDLPVLWDGIPTIIDHKSTSMLGPTFGDQFRLSPQMIGYCNAANMIPELTSLLPAGTRFQSLCVNALCIRPITRTGVPTEFVRNRYFYDDSLLDEWKLDTLALIGEFVNNFLDGYFPKKANWCIGKYGACPYLDVDSMPVGPQRSMMLRSDQYRDVTWNPLDER